MLRNHWSVSVQSREDIQGTRRCQGAEPGTSGRALPGRGCGSFQANRDLCGGLGGILAEICSVETFYFKDKKVELQTGDGVEFQNSHHPVPPLGVRFC